jgi:hypothetical protein
MAKKRGKHDQGKRHCEGRDRSKRYYRGHDLSTHEGRKAALLYMCSRMDLEDLYDKLPRIFEMDPYPVFVFEPGNGSGGVCTRKEVRRVLGERETDPLFWDYLSAEEDLPYTIYFMIDCGYGVTWIRTIRSPNPPFLSPGR